VGRKDRLSPLIRCVGISPVINDLHLDLVGFLTRNTAATRSTTKFSSEYKPIASCNCQLRLLRFDTVRRRILVVGPGGAGWSWLELAAALLAAAG
jgi:hypothetical protein